MSSELTLIRIKDPNEALGLAVRLLAAVPPFSEFPMGVSIGNLIKVIDRDYYAFARREGHAVGFVGWGFASHEVAEGWAFHHRRFSEEDFLEGPCAIIFAMQAVSPDVARFLTRRLRDDVFRDKDWLYFIRDYGPEEDGKGRRLRAARLKRPSVRRHGRLIPQPPQK